MQTSNVHMFDTLTYSNRLKAAGLDSNLAETQAELQAELFRDLADNHFATKQDIFSLRTEITKLRSEVDNKMQLMETRLFSKLGGIMVAGVGLLATLITVLHAYS